MHDMHDMHVQVPVGSSSNMGQFCWHKPDWVWNFECIAVRLKAASGFVLSNLASSRP